VHTLSVRQTDEAGNISATGTTSSWTIDTTAPSTPVLTGAPSGSTTSTSATVVFTGEVGATLTCSVDGGTYSPCSSPKTLTGLALGAHSLSVKATDAAESEWKKSGNYIVPWYTATTTSSGTSSVSSSGYVEYSSSQEDSDAKRTKTKTTVASKTKTYPSHCIPQHSIFA
jgi:hypothetical protein